MKIKLDQILHQKQTELSDSQKERSIEDLKRMIRDAEPVRSFKSAISGEFGVIAEIKKRSPSMGEMRAENFSQALDAYKNSPAVKAVSVITDSTNFGMDHSYLMKARQTGKPVLKKDFIQNEYGIYQARAYGADAVLLMASVLRNRDLAKKLYDVAGECGLDVLYEAHSQEEINRIPDGVQIYGINSRDFMKPWTLARFTQPFRALLSLPDFTTQRKAFSLIAGLPPTAVKVAESGITPRNISEVIKLGYHAALIGTSLLQAPQGIHKAVAEFEAAIPKSGPATNNPRPEQPRPYPIHG